MRTGSGSTTPATDTARARGAVENAVAGDAAGDVDTVDGAPARAGMVGDVRFVEVAAGRVVAAVGVVGGADRVVDRAAGAAVRGFGAAIALPRTSRASAAASTPAAILRLPILAHPTRPRINAQSARAHPNMPTKARKVPIAATRTRR